jgi:DNA-binding MarR family transcriptional regulator
MMKAPAKGSENFDDVPLSALLRAAQRTYTEAVDRAQSKIGCDDLPQSGAYILSAMHWTGASLDAVLRWMGVTKQAVSQAIDTLVVRGYLERSEDPEDRRRIKLVLTARGRAAGAAARSAIGLVDRRLGAKVGAQRIAATRATLAALILLRQQSEKPR